METDNFKRFMTFSRGERIAIITIVSMIVIILIAKYIIINNPPKRDYFKHDLDSIIARREAVLDSVRRADSLAKETAKANKIFSPGESSRKLGSRYARNDKKKHAKTKETAEKRTIDDSVGKRFIRQANAFASSGLHSAPLHSASVEMTAIIDLNTADTTLLKQLPGIGGAYAKWIVNYREKLGGYCETEQLLEVYRMDTARYGGIKDHVKIDSTFTPNKLKINYDTFKVLLKHPYLEYDDVKRIVNYREHKGLITSWEQLVKIVGDGIKPKLRYYVDYL
ncbi:MAG: helix-hairpin-helix domain-containing protein [Bacteroidales bacterium]|nr:helix-hairpin-helix domain-containing protein [Bacteroidales bacterium]